MSGEPVIFHSRGLGNFNTIIMESGSDATQDFSHYASINPGVQPSSDSSVFKTGGRSIKFDSGVTGATPFLRSYDFSISNGKGLSSARTSFYVRFSGGYPPEVDGALGFFFQTQSVENLNGPFQLSLRKTGEIELYTGSLQIGSPGPILSFDTWYRISVCYKMTASNINEFRLYIDGSLSITGSNITLVFDNRFARFFVGFMSPFGTSRVMNFDDLYIDDDDSLLDTGDVRVTAKLPSSDSTNNFETAIGNNPSDRWDNVDERPLSLSNGWRNTSGPWPVDENYGIQSSSTGDVDLSSYIGLYPSNLPSVGIRNNYIGGLNLYECGMLIAINSDQRALISCMSWAYCDTIVENSGGSSGMSKIWNDGDSYDPNDGSYATFSVGTANIALTTTNMMYHIKSISLPSRPFIFHSISSGEPFRFYSR